MPTNTQPHTVNLNELRIPLDELPVALWNRIDRDKRAELEALHHGLPTILRFTTSVCHATYQSIRYLAVDPAGEFGPRLDFAVAVAPLSRTLLDSLFTIIFLFDAPAANARWYTASGWREANDLQNHLTSLHANDPAWTQWLADHAAWVVGVQGDAAITQAELANPGLIRWWPNPGKMSSRRQVLTQDSVRLAFLEFLTEWQYKALSGDSHLSYLGLARRGSFLWDRAQTAMRERYRELAVLTAVTLFVSLLSEIAGELKLPAECARLRDIWDKLRPINDPGELWAKRYDALLTV